MASGSFKAVVDFLRKLGRDEKETDQDGSEPLIREGGERAFRFLIRRHGPLVCSVCRRVLVDEHEAEDAFQATMLILVRQTQAVRKQGSIKSWLYGVALRVAVRAKAQQSRRQEQQAPPRRAGAHSRHAVDWRDLRPVIDEEIGRLPEEYQLPVILCYLEGLTSEQAGRQLGCSRDAVVTRLAQARRRLRRSLTRHGLGLSTEALETQLRQNALSAPASLRMTQAALETASAVAAGKVLSTNTVPMSVTLLANEVTHAMRWTKIKAAVIVGLTIAIATLGLGGAAITYYKFAAGKNEARNQATVEWTSGAGTPLTLTWRERLAIQAQAGPEERILSVAISPNGKIVASGLESGVKLLDALTGKELRKLDRPPTVCAAFSPDGTLLAAGRPRTMKFWEVPSGKERATLKDGAGWVKSLAFAPDGKTLASTEGKTIRLWDVSTGTELRQFNPARQSIREVHAIAFSADGARLASAESDTHGLREHGSLRLWDVSTGGELATFTGHRRKATAVAYSPDGKTLASRGEGGEIKLWDIATGKERLSLAGDAQCLAFSPDGEILASAGSEVKEMRVVALRDPATGAVLATLAHEQQVFSVAFSRDGKILVSADMDAVRVWELEIRPAKR